MSNNLPAQHSVSDIEVLARHMSKSAIFSVKTFEQAFALMQVALAEGIHPAKAMMEYHLIEANGVVRPALKADAMLARFQQAGGTVKWSPLTDQRVEATFTHPAGGSVSIEWTMERAKTAGLAGKQMWQKYGRQLLRSRVISEGIRTCFPGVITGTYSVEEVQDMVESEPTPCPVQIIPESMVTVEAKATTQEAASVIKDALAGKKTAPSKPLPAPKEAVVVEGGDAAEVIGNIKQLAGILKETPLSIVKRLTKGTVSSLPAIEKLPFNHLQRLAELVKKELVAESAAAESFDPFEVQPEPAPVQDALFEVEEENPFELPD